MGTQLKSASKCQVPRSTEFSWMSPIFFDNCEVKS